MKKTSGEQIFLQVNKVFKKKYCYFLKFYVQVKITILRKNIKWQFQKEKQHHPEKAREDLITRSWQLTQLNVQTVVNSSLLIMSVILAGITTKKKSLIKLNLVKILI